MGIIKTLLYLLCFLYIAGLSVNQQDNGNTSVKATDYQHVIPEDSSSTGGLCNVMCIVCTVYLTSSNVLFLLQETLLILMVLKIGHLGYQITLPGSNKCESYQ